MRIVMICTGNTCRSPMAEALMRRALETRGIKGVEVSSAGVYAMSNDAASPEAQREMASRGLTIMAHRARHIREVDLQGALVLCMTKAHLDAAKRLAPDVDADTLMHYAGLNADVADPIGAGPDAYRRAADQMQRAVDMIVDKMTESKE